MMYLFMVTERGEFAGWQTGHTPADIITLRRQKDSPLFALTDNERILDDSYYVPNMSDVRDNWRIVKRPKIRPKVSKTTIRADGIDETQISGLPIPCRMLVNGEEVIVEDGSLELAVDVAAQYRVEMDQWPYVNWSVVIRGVKP